MIRTTCPQCGREDAIADYLASLPVLCKQCGQRVTMGEVIAPSKPVLPPPVAKAPSPPPPPPAPPKAVSPPPPPPPAAKPAPLSKPEPAAPVVTESEPPKPDLPVHTNGAVITPRAAFLNAEGPGKVDLFEDVIIPEQRTARPPLPPVPPPPLPAPVSVAPVGVSFHRGRRLAARLITLVGAVVAVVAGILLVGFAPGVVKNDRLLSAVFLLVPFGLYALYNVVLLGTKGQDFGKRALKLHVIGDDGTPARFARAFLKRELVVILLLAGLIPLAWKLYKFQQAGTLPEQWRRVGANLLMPEVLPAAAAVLFSLLNAALIFGRDGKCLHDKLAKTTVTRS